MKRRSSNSFRLGAATVALAVLLPLTPRHSHAETWMLKAQHQMTCTSATGAAERSQLDVQWLPESTAAANQVRQLRDYVVPARAAAKQKLFRYLSLLAGFAYQADYSNDQFMRSQFDGYIMAHALQGMNHASPEVLTQIFLCSQVRLMEAMHENGNLNEINQLAVIFTDHYRKLALSGSVTDWPLIRALRLMTVAPEGLDRGIDDLVAVALGRANALERVDPLRVSRLFANAARVRLLMGEAKEAMIIGARSIVLVPETYRTAATWRAFPAMYDAVRITQADEPPTAIGMTQGILEQHGFPEGLNDPEIDFAVYLRLAEAYKQLGMDNSSFLVLAFRELINLQNDIVTMTFMRNGLRRLAELSENPVDMLLQWQSRDPLPAGDLARAGKLYEFLLDQRRGTVVTDARVQMLSAFITESLLYSLSRHTPRNAREQVAITDLSFRALQLDSFTRVSVAAAATGLQHVQVNEKQRFQLEKFYTYTAMHSAWLQAAGWRIVVPPGAALPDADELWTSFMTITTFQNETTTALDQYYDILRQVAPGVAAMTVPYAQPLDEFQRKLSGTQAVLATVVGADALYVWGIRNNRARFVRMNRSAEEVAESVRAVRASVAAHGSGTQLEVPAFGAAAFELYAATFGQVGPTFEGADHVFWYGDGVLGSLPPAILVTETPNNPKPIRMAELRGTRFLVDQYSLSSLPDLYLGKTAFLRPRESIGAVPTFAGIGAPLLSTEQLAQETLSSSFELAGGTSVDDLRELARLPAAREELNSLSAMFDDPLVWLGPDADEARLKAAPLDSYRVLAFATHGFTRSDIKGQMYPSLLLAPPEQSQGANDGLLTTLEIGGLKLNADLVLLSACNTATSDGRPDAEAFSGLAQSFLVAGARSLMVSHWPVASGAASELSVATVRQWLAGKPLAKSLQGSIQRIRNQAGRDIEAHPFFWGPFVLADDGASGLGVGQP